MSLLVVGVSHHTAPVELLESIAIPASATPDVLSTLVAQPHVSEAVVLSTCNRVEVYASVNAFHGGLTEVGSVLAARAGLDVTELAAHLYVHFDKDAAHHALRVAAGLDSMVGARLRSSASSARRTAWRPSTTRWAGCCTS